MRALTIVTTLALAAIIPGRAAAQTGIAGRWTTEFDIGIRNQNGVESSMGKREATITLAVKGDSVTGTWQAAADGTNPVPAPIHLRGTVAGNKVVLTSDAVERTVRKNDDEQKVFLLTVYTVEIHGDQLDGTSKMAAIDGSIEGNDRPFTAKRVKN